MSKKKGSICSNQKKFKRKYVLKQREKMPVGVRFDDKEFTSRYKRVALRSLPNVM